MRLKLNLNYIKTNWWILFLLLFSLFSLLSQVYTDRWVMQDLEVYIRTAQRMLGGEEIYRIAADEHYVYKYHPSAAIFFIPLTVIPLVWAKLIYWIGITFLLGFVLHKLQKLIISEYGEISNNLYWYPAFFALLTILIHLHCELSLGQVNLALLILYVFIIFNYKKDRKFIVALLISISIFFKPFGLLFLPYLLLKKQYKTLLYILTCILILLAVPLLFYHSVESFRDLNFAWINELKIELSNKQDLFAPANHTVFSVLARYTPLRFILETKTVQTIYQLCLLASIGLLYMVFERRSKSEIAEIAALILLIPLIASTTKNAFIFSLPLALYLITAFKNHNIIIKILTITGCLLIGGNIYEVFGRSISFFLTDISIYTIGSILLLIALYISVKDKKNRVIKKLNL